MILAILSLHVARSLSLSLCSRGYMSWKKMLVEEFQDSCLMLDPLWHLNGMSSAFLCNLSACCLPSSFCSRGYMVWKKLFENFQEGCLVHGHLWYLNGMIWANQALHFDLVSAQEDKWFERRYCLKCWRQLPWRHNTMSLPAVSLQSPVSTNLATALYKYADGFLVLNSSEK